MNNFVGQLPFIKTNRKSCSEPRANVSTFALLLLCFCFRTHNRDCWLKFVSGFSASQHSCLPLNFKLKQMTSAYRPFNGYFTQHIIRQSTTSNFSWFQLMSNTSVLWRTKTINANWHINKFHWNSIFERCRKFKSTHTNANTEPIPFPLSTFATQVRGFVLFVFFCHYIQLHY